MRPLVDNAGDAKQSRKARQAVKRREQEQEQAFSATISTYDGRLTVWWIIGLCGPLRAPYSPGMDSLQLAFNTGKSDVGRQLYKKLTDEYPKQYLAMQQEEIDRAKRYQPESQPEGVVVTEGATTADTIGDTEE